MMCDISVLISMISPRLALAGTLIRAEAIRSRSSVQAASVTTTSTLADQNVPSESFAIATIFWLSARRMRVETWARPACGPR